MGRDLADPRTGGSGRLRWGRAGPRDRRAARGESPSYFDGYRRNGVGEVIFVFRSPFDFETIERIGEVCDQALG